MNLVTRLGFGPAAVAGLAGRGGVVADRRTIAVTLGMSLIVAATASVLALIHRLKRHAESMIDAFGPYRSDVYLAASLAGDRDPHATALKAARPAAGIVVTEAEADVFYAASLAGDCHPYETAMGLLHPH